MAQYSTDFGEYTTGVQPDDWAEKWNTADQNFTVEEVRSPGQGKVLRGDNSSQTPCGLAWDDIGEVADCEILARIQDDVDWATTGYVVARGGGAAGSEEGIFIWFDNYGLKLSNYGGSFSSQSLLNSSEDTWYWVRLKVSGTSVKAKAWANDLSDEPDEWTVEVTESNLTSGWVGVAQYHTYKGFTDWFSVGTGTDSAPAPDNSSLPARVTKHYIEAALESAGDQTARITKHYIEVAYLSPDELTSVVSTEEATDITAKTATLNGNLEHLWLSSLDAWFDYGTDESFAEYSSTTPQAVTETGSFSGSVGSLTPLETHYFRAAVTDGTDTWYGETVSFIPADITYIEDEKSEFESGVLVGVVADQEGLKLDYSETANAESFEADFGDWENDLNHDLDWSRRSGGTPSGSTGPSSAHDGSYYVYVEASNASAGDESILVFDIGYIADGCVDFYYHQYGIEQGSLYLEGWDGSAWNEIWSSVGNQGDEWLNVTSPDTDFSGFSKLRFRNVAASGYRGDVALDLIDVSVNVYESSGNRVTAGINLSGLAEVVDSLLLWTSDEPTDTSLTIESSYSTDGGSTWSSWESCADGSAVPSLAGSDADSVRFRQSLSTIDTAATPTLTKFELYVSEQAAKEPIEVDDLETINEIEEGRPFLVVESLLGNNEIDTAKFYIKAEDLEVGNEVWTVFAGISCYSIETENEIDDCWFLPFTVFPESLEAHNEITEAEFKYLNSTGMEIQNVIATASLRMAAENLEVNNIVMEAEIMDGLYPLPLISAGLAVQNEITPARFASTAKRHILTFIY